jgi:hypothetical protein
MHRTALSIFLATLLIGVQGCSLTGKSDSQKAQEIIVSVCGITETKDAEGKDVWQFKESGESWSFDDSTGSIQELRDSLVSEATDANQASQLDSTWSEFASAYADLVTFTDAVLRAKQKGITSFKSAGLDGERDYNIPNGRIKSACRALAQSLSS